MPESGLLLTALFASVMANLCLSSIVVMQLRATSKRAPVRPAERPRRPKPVRAVAAPSHRPRPTRHGAIVELTRKGMTPAAVAKATGAAQGEIDLVLSLENLKRQTASPRPAA